MKRRDTFTLIPLALAGAGSLTAKSFAQRKPLMPHPMRDGSQPLSLTYTRNVIKMLKWVRENQSENILEAAYAIARTYMKGKRIWSCWDLGHTAEADLFPGRNGQPDILTAGYEMDKVKDGDLVLANFPWPRGYIEDLAKRDLFIIGGPCPWGGDVKGYENIVPDIQKLKIRPFADIWIETNCDHIGAQVKIPGSPAPLGPESGPLNGTIFWMMMADACRVLAIEGKSAKVKGDEPKLSGGNVPLVNLDAPLMDNYFDEVLRQLELVGSELGNIRKMANMAVDTLLDGGNVYFYSRYEPSLAGEASGRRGGFLFAKGMSDGHIAGTSKDCVIMGTYKPDDEADLKNLDEMKNRGMRVASIGPLTRDFKIPDGRAVYKETEVHVGRMCDTYGLFAVPGFDQKICPTSGILATSILWTMSVELAEEIIRRTGGNVPGIFFNGALTWSANHNASMSALAAERGY
ncbi:MAG: hypothetical protein JXB48_24630 [Candidatus Latescibacteria bacterium]|nr:hypothetical protein [Candidatus Latescibacterota bacterium]